MKKKSEIKTAKAPYFHPIGQEANVTVLCTFVYLDGWHESASSIETGGDGGTHEYIGEAEKLAKCGHFLKGLPRNHSNSRVFFSRLF